MARYFYDNILRFDLINKLNYTYSSKVPKYIKIQLVLDFNHLKDVLSSLVFIKICINSYAKVYLNLKKNLSINLVIDSIKNKACYKLFLVLILKRLVNNYKLFDFSYFYYYKLKLIQLQRLQQVYIFLNKLKVIPININKNELEFITINSAKFI